jgi:uncharacterized protein (TIGR00730 family)
MTRSPDSESAHGAAGRRRLNRICVFCGSSPGNEPVHRETARAFGARLATRGIEVIYGGGSVGLMGAVADGALAAGGSVTGIIPRALWEREVGHAALSELEIVETMHHRKARMAERADAFVALPGGLGTMEELFEVWTWAQLGIHAKPCAVLNVDGFYDPLIGFLSHMAAQGFLREAHRSMLLVDTDADRLLDRLGAYVPPATEKWIDLSRS